MVLRTDSAETIDMLKFMSRSSWSTAQFTPSLREDRERELY